MCGIFGIRSNNIDSEKLNSLVINSRRRGKDSSGIFSINKDLSSSIYKSNEDILKLKKKISLKDSYFIMGHSRLATNGDYYNQPVFRDEILVIHNGIIVNDEGLWEKISFKKKFEIDSEIIIGLTLEFLKQNGSLKNLHEYIFSNVIGSVSCVIYIRELQKAVLMSNNGSLFYSFDSVTNDIIFSSEMKFFRDFNVENVAQLKNDSFVFELQSDTNDDVQLIQFKKERRLPLLPSFNHKNEEQALLEYKKVNLLRCKKCILPCTMPFITFNEDGVCNYCLNYRISNQPKPKENLLELVDRYRSNDSTSDCIVPFSGGRDSCMALHLIVKDLRLKPVTFTYDWGMVTDLGRRNISTFCSDLGVENIIFADDIALKRKYISNNLKAWLKNPDLGMISILTAGDKHFFRHINTVKKDTGIDLNIWGINPLETTHFKAGFLGVSPSFESTSVYNNGWMKQFIYQGLRFKSMLRSPGYFNSSIFDTLQGEFYRSIVKKNDYFHLFDYYRWDEEEIDGVLSGYNWERAIDTSTSWRIGDGTAAFYNYIYYTVAGFTEHDTFRSNQIREGQISREKALALVEIENQPRYPNIKWYLDILGFDFKATISIVNGIPKLYDY